MNLYIEDVGIKNAKIIKKVLRKYNIHAPISLYIISKRRIKNIEIKVNTKINRYGNIYKGIGGNK